MGTGLGMLRVGVGSVFARRPAVPMAMALIGGIAVSGVVPRWPVGWVVALGMLVLLSAATFRQGVLQSIILMLAFAMAGLAAAQVEAVCFPGRHIALFTSDEGKLAELEVRVTSTPRVAGSVLHGRPLPPKQFARGEVVKVKTRRGWEEACGEILVTIDQPHPMLALGQVIRVVGVLQRPMGAMNPGEFDAAGFYRSQRVLAGVTVPHLDGVVIVREAGWEPLGTLREKARRLLAAGFTEGQSLDHSVLLALSLGDRDREMMGVQDDFSRSGTAHLLAVSGLHVVLVAGCVMLACRLVGLHPRKATIVMMAVVLLYAAIAVPAAPVIRATVLCLALGAGQLTRRHRDGIQILALCAAGLLIHHPQELHSAGFQLSFVTVLGMLVAARPVLECANAIYEDEDLRVARSFRPPGLWESAWIGARAHVTGAIAISAVAWMVSMPLVMCHFDQLNPWAVFAGLLLFPVVALGLVGGLLKILFTLLLPSFASTWAALSAYPMIWMRREVNWLAHLPGANVPIGAMAGWRIALFYALLALPLLAMAFPAGRRWLKCGPLAAVLLAMVPIFVGASPTNGGVETRITLLSIGAGQVGIVELADGRTLLIDDGSNSVGDPLRKCLGPYLRSRGCRHIETIFLSHPDFDHISATADVADEYHPDRVMLSPVFRAQAKGNMPAEEMLRHLDQGHVPIETVARGRTIPLGKDVGLEVLWPPEGRAFTSTNNAGVVLKLNCHGTSVLFPADIQVATERELIDHPEHLHADVLVAPHHGSAESTTAEFIHAVGAKIILSSNDRRLSKKQREFDHIVNGLRLYRTSVWGAVTLRISREGVVRVEGFLKKGDAGK